MTFPPRTQSLLVYAAIAALPFLSGCGGFDGVQMEGKIFDAIGINSEDKPKEAKLAARAPLVVPPSVAHLPQPGQSPDAQASDITAAINDPDRAKNGSKEALERQQAEYCAKHYDPQRAVADEAMATVEGPLGQCRQSILTAIGGLSKGNDDSADQ